MLDAYEFIEQNNWLGFAMAGPRPRPTIRLASGSEEWTAGSQDKSAVEIRAKLDRENETARLAREAERARIQRRLDRRLEKQREALKIQEERDHQAYLAKRREEAQEKAVRTDEFYKRKGWTQCQHQLHLFDVRCKLCHEVLDLEDVLELHEFLGFKTEHMRRVLTGRQAVCHHTMPETGHRCPWCGEDLAL